MSLQSGLEAFKQKRYGNAVQYLEAFLGSGQGTIKDKLQGQIALVKAYYQYGQTEEAIALCEKLTQSKNPQIRTWAEDTLPQLQNPMGSSVAQLLKTGKAALKNKQYDQAISAFEAYCNRVKEKDTKAYGEAQMGLVKAYQAIGQVQEAIALCQELIHSEDMVVESWAQQMLPALKASEAKQKSTPQPKPKNRPFAGVRLAMTGTKDSLALVSGITLFLLCGMVFSLFLAMFVMVGSDNPLMGLNTAIALTLSFNALVFFLSPTLMDLMQGWLYSTRWVSLADIERKSPESAQIIQRICQKQHLQQPKLGIIADQTPTAFTYGSLPNTARIVVSEGLFTYLNDEEIATVYAHELGHVVHWDFAIMTLAGTLVQIMYLIYVWLTEKDSDNNKTGVMAGRLAIAAYIFYLIGTYLILYLSRIREYYADHFSAQSTGNPNALGRALVKIAYGVLEENEHKETPSRVSQGTRALGIYDPKAASTTGTAYRLASENHRFHRIFLWDLFNPWAFWMELQSTHPLTGKRIRALATYAEKLGLPREFDMATVVKEGKQLSKKKLYGNFTLDILRYLSPWLGGGIGILLTVLTGHPAYAFLCFGLGMLFYSLSLFPRFKQWTDTDVFTLLCNPYASPLHPLPATLNGKVIGRGDSGYAFGSDLMFQDDTGLMFIHYASFWGPIGNFLFGASRANQLIGEGGKVRGWFRRGVSPYLDLHQMSLGGELIKGYHDAWLLIVSVFLILIGILLFLVV